MSHFAVAVIHEKDQDINEMLAPYNENINVEPYVEYTKEELIGEAKAHKERWIKYMAKEGKKADASVAELMKANTDEELYTAEREFREKYYNQKFNENGDAMSTYNPDSKWDWWCYGGRFSDLLYDMQIANGADENEAFVNGDSIQIKNFDPNYIDQESYEWDKRWFEVVVLKDKPRNKEEKEYDSFYKPEYLLERYKTADDYAKQCNRFSTCAVVTPDGKWHEAGTIGWFASTTATPQEEYDWSEQYYDRFIKTANPEHYLTIIDCHI